jgi:hypothetical protein
MNKETFSLLERKKVALFISFASLLGLFLTRLHTSAMHLKDCERLLFHTQLRTHTHTPHLHILTHTHQQCIPRTASATISHTHTCKCLFHSRFSLSLSLSLSLFLSLSLSLSLSLFHTHTQTRISNAPQGLRVSPMQGALSSRCGRRTTNEDEALGDGGGGRGWRGGCRGFNSSCGRCG